MKKANLFMYVLLTMFIVSCSKDDDSNNTTDDDLLIGVWKPVKDVWTNNGVVEVYNYNTCEQKSRITFEGNGNMKTLSFYDNEGTSNCIEDNYGFISGSWEKISEGSYKVTTTYYDEYTKKNETDIDTVSISFPTPNTMKVLYDATDYSEYSRVR
ncbi:MAG TPA: lipocalin family protein [Lutibacter sp.]